MKDFAFSSHILNYSFKLKKSSSEALMLGYGSQLWDISKLVTKLQTYLQLEKYNVAFLLVGWCFLLHVEFQSVVLNDFFSCCCN